MGVERREALPNGSDKILAAHVIRVLILETLIIDHCKKVILWKIKLWNKF